MSEESYNKYISKHIRNVYRRRLFSPILYLIILLVTWLTFPMYDVLFPQKLTDSDEISVYTKQHSAYVETDLKDLYFTGYTSTSLGRAAGYYYYTMRGDQCTIVLLSPHTCEEGLPFIESLHIRGKVLKGGSAYRTLLGSLSKDLNWTEQGISKQAGSHFISEPAFQPIPSAILILVYLSTGLYALLHVILNILYMKFPVLAPACRRLGRFGKPSELLAQAEEELATLPQLATEDMFITEHYFIVLANYGVAIFPIPEILWIYKHSTLHKILWRHFSISYTLHVTANKHLYIQCPKNMKSDIDGIIDYLSEANHDILVGFSEENRRKVREMQPYPPTIERIIELFQKGTKGNKNHPDVPDSGE
ncbi:MAG: hypothetical protein HFH48_07985 [Lachnospiraceae bacterium]|nr:hypothetical protein [Lachnospiraceae bacterium]